MVSAQNLDNGLYARIDTSRGDILVRLFYERAPLTVTNFVGLAEGTIDSSRGEDVRFFDGLRFHRVVADFVIQGGDPAGNGTGGPGYTFPDEFHPDLRHSGPGILSMANRGPDTNGSQIFITHVATPWLDNKHAVFGHVVEGLDVVNAIEQGDRITRVTIIRRGAAARNFTVDQERFEELADELQARQAEIAGAKRKADLDLIQSKWPDTEETDNGIRYVVIKRGTGRKSPDRGDPVTVHYSGSLLDGTVFGSSEGADPLQFSIGEVIEGWNQMLTEMKKGEVRLAIIPPELAYGERGFQGAIPPHSFVVFEIELVDF